MIDALKDALGNIVCLVTLGGDISHGKDKSVASERTALWVFDATRLLREFACTVAENALLAEREAGREPDHRSFAAIEVARRFITGNATEKERVAAYCAATYAASDAVHYLPCGLLQDSAPYCAAHWAAKSAAGKLAHWSANSAAHGAANRKANSAAHKLTDSMAYRVGFNAAQAEQNAMLTSMLMHEYNK